MTDLTVDTISTFPSVLDTATSGLKHCLEAIGCPANLQTFFPFFPIHFPSQALLCQRTIGFDKRPSGLEYKDRTPTAYASVETAHFPPG